MNKARSKTFGKVEVEVEVIFTFYQTLKLNILQNLCLLWRITSPNRLSVNCRPKVTETLPTYYRHLIASNICTKTRLDGMSRTKNCLGELFFTITRSSALSLTSTLLFLYHIQKFHSHRLLLSIVAINIFHFSFPVWNWLLWLFTWRVLFRGCYKCLVSKVILSLIFGVPFHGLYFSNWYLQNNL